jgi:hypothetical protein
VARFIQAINAPKLQSFELFSVAGIGPETFLALNQHGASLRFLRLCLKPEVCPDLHLLKDCTAIEALIVEDCTSHGNMARNPDQFLEIVNWIAGCRNLKVLELAKQLSGADLVTPILQTGSCPQLESLQVECYSVRVRREFHLALRNQTSLKTLFLHGDALGCTRDDIDILCDSLCQLTNLRDLKLRGVSELFRDDSIIRLARSLIHLHSLYVEGYSVTDAVWPALAGLRNLQSISLNGLTSFTKQGLLRFIDALSCPGNEGMVLMVDYADADSGLDQTDEQDVRLAIAKKLDGRFEYTLSKGRSPTQSYNLQLEMEHIRMRAFFLCPVDTASYAWGIDTFLIKFDPNYGGRSRRFRIRG